MSRKICVLVIFWLAVCLPALFAATGPVGFISEDATVTQGASVDSTATAGSVSINHSNVFIENNGTEEVYFKFNNPVAAVKLTDFYLNLGENITINASAGKKIVKIGYVCNTAETATFRYLAWD